jgi:HlyD family secretion protein
MDQRILSANEPQPKDPNALQSKGAPVQQSPRQRWLRRVVAWVAIVVVAVAIALYAWRHNQPTPIPPGIAMSNGRIEATEIDVATKLAGRIKDVLAQEGDFVEAGQVIARMDTQTLEAELRQAEAQARQAGSAITTAEAVVAQRKSELAFAQREQNRSEDLVARGFISPQKLDSDRTRTSTAKAALAAAQSQVIETRSTL